MQSVVDRILDDNFNTDNSTLSFSEPVIELNLEEGIVYEGSFEIYGPEKVLVEGSVSVTGLRMKCPVSDFSGSLSQVPYYFDTKGLVPGETFRGEFRIISNHGEYLVPYDVKINASSLDTSLGNIKNLFHFTNLARSNWQESVSLFFSENFEHILTGVERQYTSVYHALKASVNKEQALEEFLLYIKKKQPVEFLIEEPDIRIDNPSADTERFIVIQRNGWGYSDLKIICNCDFIDIHKNSIGQEDFDGNRGRIPYGVNTEKLHNGRNYGQIRLVNAYNDVRIQVCVINNTMTKRMAEVSKNEKHQIVDLIKYYEAFRCKKISSSTWLTSTGKIVDELCNLNPENKIYELYRAQILITTERYNEARWILEQVEGYISDVEDDVIYCYYYYLTTLIDRSSEHTEYVTSVVSKLYDKQEDEWRLFWLLLYLSEDYAKSPKYRWEGLKRQFELGSSSPIIFVEAFHIISNNPTILSELGRFEKQLLRYMAKKEILSAGIIEQLLYIMGNNKSYDKNLLPLLKACYKLLPNDDVLKTIVTLLININRLDSEAHEWYAKGIDKNIRITKLYEYYMMSLDLESGEEIPKMVLMYFAFDSSLDVFHNSYLYAYVYRNKDVYESIYENYRGAIERFVSFQLINGNNNEYLSYLYKNMITPTMITADVAKGLSKALFVNLIVPNRDDIRLIKLENENLEEEYTFKVPIDKKVYMPIYGNNYRIVLITEGDDRLIREEEYEIERLMPPEMYADSISEYIENVLFDLWVCEPGRELKTVTASNVENMKRLSLNPIVDIKLRKEMLYGIIKFYFEDDRMGELDDTLNRITMQDINPEVVIDIIHILIKRGFYDKAYEWVIEGGQENLEPKMMVKLCSRIINNRMNSMTLFEEDKNLTQLIYRAFQSGRSDNVLLEYLIRYFDGTSKEMKNVIRVADEHGVDTLGLKRKFLEQLLYSNAFVSGTKDIFCAFADCHIDDRLSMAFLARVCFDYFVNEKIIDRGYIDALEKSIEREDSIPFVCKLAYTKYYAEHKDRADEKISRTLASYLKSIMLKGMYFAYFKEYAPNVVFMHRFIDKTFVEYRTKDGVKATINYSMEKDAEGNQDFTKEEMKNMYYGICVKQFVLFFGERLQYYISEKEGTEEHLTESGTLTNNDMSSHEGNSRYSMINDIAIARNLGDNATMEKLLVEYFQNEYLLNNMFGMSE